jgi:hypothetical protein
MAFKSFTLDDTTPVTIYKRRASSNIRLSVTATGAVRVTIPAWAPYASGLAFAKSRLTWIKAQIRPQALVTPGQTIGKHHVIEFVNARTKAPRSRIQSTKVTVYHPTALDWNSMAVQRIAESASIKALKQQAETQLPNRLKSLADRLGYEYSSVKIKRLKSRWGSCDSNKNIVLNLFLMQLPWECIDYVIIHELVHTEHLHHGPGFWAAMERHLPNAKQIRKRMRQYQPNLHSATP